MSAILAGTAAVFYGAIGLGFAFRNNWRKEDPLSYTMGLFFFLTLALMFGLAAVSL